mmetsp:Transcript_45780/g.116384  ORF Transcript_45780/g.116384 Transcript_45780/m.116384 type:complete len:221 (+) Transcript_45780:624-1286(+)
MRRRQRQTRRSKGQEPSRRPPAPLPRPPADAWPPDARAAADDGRLPATRRSSGLRPASHATASSAGWSTSRLRLRGAAPGLRLWPPSWLRPAPRRPAAWLRSPAGGLWCAPRLAGRTSRLGRAAGRAGSAAAHGCASWRTATDGSPWCPPGCKPTLRCTTWWNATCSAGHASRPSWWSPSGTRSTASAGRAAFMCCGCASAGCCEPPGGGTSRGHRLCHR